MVLSGPSCLSLPESRSYHQQDATAAMYRKSIFFKCMRQVCASIFFPRDRILEYTQENGENIQTAFVVPAFEELKELGAHLVMMSTYCLSLVKLVITNEGLVVFRFHICPRLMQHTSPPQGFRRIARDEGRTS